MINYKLEKQCASIMIVIYLDWFEIRKKTEI